MQHLNTDGDPKYGSEDAPGAAKGEPPAPESEKRERRAGVMLKQAEYERVARLARKESRSVSSAIRLLILDALARRSAEDA